MKGVAILKSKIANKDMNQVLEVIKRRRTTRKFKEEQLKEEELSLIMEAAIHAPSGHNSQPWHFTVIQNKELLDELNVLTKESIKDFPIEHVRKLATNEKFNVFYNAPTVVLVSGKVDGHTTIQDCSAATENILLAAESLDIGACWVGLITLLFNSPEFEKIKSKLNIPEGFKALHAIDLGYKAIKPAMEIERKQNISYIK